MPQLFVAVCLAAAPAPAARDAGRQVSYADLLSTYVTSSGEVDYGRWQKNKEDVARLDALVAQMRAASPFDRPELYRAETEKLGYWLDLYNALVVREILSRWPLSSVRLVRGADGGTRGGDAIFRDLSFVIGKRQMTLDQIENEVIRGTYKDARVHFALNCGSKSCPSLSRESFLGPKMNAQLDAATRAFVNDTHNVEVDARRKLVRLSVIFDWYADDFARAAQEKGQPADALGFVALYAQPPLAQALAVARKQKYQLELLPYDWTVNSSRAEPPSAVGVGQSAADFSCALPGGKTFSLSQARGKVVLIDFWATWCKPCRATFPGLAELYRKHRGKGLELIGVAAEEHGEPVASFLAATRAEFPICADPDGKVQGPWSVNQLPTEVLVDKKGVVRFRHEGADADALKQLESEVELLLREP